MTNIKNDRFIKALLRQPVDRPPVWLMRQAGRYLPEYRKLRQQVPDFLTFCKTPEITTMAALQPLARYDLDASIVFSDILVIPEALGVPVKFAAGEGPIIEQPIRHEQDLQRLRSIDPEIDLAYVMQTIQLLQHELAGKLPLIGFAGSPWTVATYMVEGGSSRTFRTIRAMMYRNPQLLHGLLQHITTATIAYLNAQVRAGVNVLMLFDTWGGILSLKNYQEFSLQYLTSIAHQVLRKHNNQTIPLIFFTKHSGLWLETIAQSGCDCIGVDETTDIVQARLRVGNKVALQGNIDPYLLFASPQQIAANVQDLLQAYGPYPGHIVNLGHGIDQDTPPDNVAILVDTVKTFNRVGA